MEMGFWQEDVESIDTDQLRETEITGLLTSMLDVFRATWSRQQRG